jgi:hypothetical protein
MPPLLLKSSPAKLWPTTKEVMEAIKTKDTVETTEEDIKTRTMEVIVATITLVIIEDPGVDAVITTIEDLEEVSAMEEVSANNNLRIKATGATQIKVPLNHYNRITLLLTVQAMFLGMEELRLHPQMSL